MQFFNILFVQATIKYKRI